MYFITINIALTLFLVLAIAKAVSVKREYETELNKLSDMSRLMDRAGPKDPLRMITSSLENE